MIIQSGEKQHLKKYHTINEIETTPIFEYTA
jgi:hypothetical protein